MTTGNFSWASDVLARRYPAWHGIDDLIEEALSAHVGAGAIVLDAGCGQRSPLGRHGDRARLVVGTDIDLAQIRQNVDCGARGVADGARLPFQPGAFDVALSKTAIEHMADPEAFFAGVCDLLKPGGVFIWATSNLRALPIRLSRMTPLALHQWVYRKVFNAEQHVEAFPTYYRANTEAALERQLASAGFEPVASHRVSWPHYFAFSRIVFRAMLPVHRWSDAQGLQWLQVHLVGVSRKR